MGYMVGRRLVCPFFADTVGTSLDEDRLMIGRYLFFSMEAVVFFGRFIAVLRMFAALLAGANSIAAGSFFFFNITGESAGRVSSASCLCSGRRNLQDFRNTECDLIGLFIAGDMHSQFSFDEMKSATPSSGGSPVRSFVRMTKFVNVQVFGRRHEEPFHALWRPASKKRQGTKSREVGHR